MRFSDEELALVKSAFADDDVLAQAIRKVFFEEGLSEAEGKRLTEVVGKNDAMQSLMRKFFLPELSTDVPIGQALDLYMTVQIADKSPLEAVYHLDARSIVIELMESHLAELAGATPQISYRSLEEINVEEPEATYVAITARNTYIQHIESVLGQIILLAGSKDETPDETIERLKKDSSK